MSDHRFLPRGRFSSLIDALAAAGYRCLGPQARDGAIVFGELDGPDALPAGVRSEQGPGSYRLTNAADGRLFAWSNGPQALKPLVFAPREQMWRSTRDGDGRLAFEEVLPQVEPTAVIGVRSCDLAALSLQDRHFLGQFPEPYYAARRESLFLVAVNCSHPSDTCFCVSTGDGPVAEGGFDLVLDELDDGFMVAAGSIDGGDILATLETVELSTQQFDAVKVQRQGAATAQTRSLPSRNLRHALFSNLGHPRWDEIAGRCLSCTNCTLVCPTCFCHEYEEQPALNGTESANFRNWDSCFTEGHSYIHGSVVRDDTRKRYRQWLTHKLGGWHDQFGRSGCVGCGRCITWCPVGIDITEEASVLAQ